MRVVVMLTLVAALSGLAACGKKAEKAESAVVADPVASAVAESVLTQDQAIAAMLRGHPNSRKVCVDDLRENSFFLDYGPLLPAGAEPDGLWHGWVFIEKVEFYRTSNNTWFIIDMPDSKYTKIYPDVAGLNCKEK